MRGHRGTFYLAPEYQLLLGPLVHLLFKCAQVIETMRPRAHTAPMLAGFNAIFLAPSDKSSARYLQGVANVGSFDPLNSASVAVFLQDGFRCFYVGVVIARCNFQKGHDLVSELVGVFFKNVHRSNL